MVCEFPALQGTMGKYYAEADGEDTVQVQPDFELIAFDFVSNPSTHGAFLSPVNESKGSVTNKFANVERIITDIITEF